MRVAVSNMYAAFTKILSRAGIDQRDFALVAFGGAGPLVGSLLAREVGIPTVFVPRSPGTLCALGAITADILNDAVRTVHGRLDALDLRALAREQRALEADLLAWVQEHGVQVASTSFRHGADMRYVGQSYEIEVPVEPALARSRPRRAASRRASTRRTSASSAMPTRTPRWKSSTCASSSGACGPACRWSRWPPARAPCRRARGESGSTAGPPQARVYERASLGSGDRVAGPAIVEQPDTTVLVPEGDVADVDRFGNLLIKREA